HIVRVCSRPEAVNNSLKSGAARRTRDEIVVRGCDMAGSASAKTGYRKLTTRHLRHGVALCLGHCPAGGQTEGSPPRNKFPDNHVFDLPTNAGLRLLESPDAKSFCIRGSRSGNPRGLRRELHRVSRPISQQLSDRYGWLSTARRRDARRKMTGARRHTAL